MSQSYRYKAYCLVLFENDSAYKSIPRLFCLLLRHFSLSRRDSEKWSREIEIIQDRTCLLVFWGLLWVCFYLIPERKMFGGWLCSNPHVEFVCKEFITNIFCRRLVFTKIICSNWIWYYMRLESETLGEGRGGMGEGASVRGHLFLRGLKRVAVNSGQTAPQPSKLHLRCWIVRRVEAIE